MDDRADSELYNAMVSDDFDTFKKLLETGGNVNEYYVDPINEDAVSLLHVACQLGKDEYVKEIIKKDVILNVADKNGLTPLMHALASGNMSTAEVLLQTDLDLVNDEECNGLTALDLAALDGNAEAVRLLAQYGADINHQTFDGVTPVMRCVWQGMMQDPAPVLWALVECGADVNIKDKKCRRTALQLASLKKNTRAAEVLISAGADLYSLDSGAKTPLTNMILQHVRPRNGAVFIHEDVWTILLMMEHAGIDYNRYTFEDGDPMLTAALVKAEPLIRFFLTNGANPNQQTALGVTPLLKCTSKNDLASVRTLVEWNCRLDIKGQYYKRYEDREYTVDPYELAILQGHFDVAKFLIDAGYIYFQKQYLFEDVPMPRSLAANPEMIVWLKERSLNPESLTQLAVFAVRRALHKDAVTGVQKLPLPPKLRRMVVLKDLLNLDVEV